MLSKEVSEIKENLVKILLQLPWKRIQQTIDDQSRVATLKEASKKEVIILF